jgi:4-amino-4-deoxy-L-arabinose transferase-like glycosyltransferase
MVSKQAFRKYDKAYKTLVIIILALIIPSFFINIRQLTLIPDEAIRTLVALEMTITGDYITPKMGDEFYYKKPPVYNWIIATYYNITGDYTEMGARLPMLLSLFAFALSIFLILRRHYGFRIAFLAAMVYIIYPRITTYESLFGLIDMTYSWVVFLSWIAIYHYHKHEKYWHLFLISYALAAFSFLMKGIPSIAYQGITLFVVFILGKNFRKLFSLPHVAGGMLFLLITGTYYYAYYLKNPEQIGILLQTIFNESADKSGLAFGVWDVILHSFSFLVEIAYTYLPATLILLFFFNKHGRQSFYADTFIRFLVVVSLANMSIYLISPITYMRYVLPHFALLSMAFVMMYAEQKNESRSLKIIHIFFIVVSLIVFMGHLAYGFITDFNVVEHKWIKIASLSILLLPALLIVLKKRLYQFELLILAMLVFKLGFNWFIIPSRVDDNDGYLNTMRESSYKTGEIMQGKKAIVFNEGLIQTTHFYLTSGKQEVIPRTRDTTGIDYFIAYAHPFPEWDKQIIMNYRVEGTPINLRVIKWK